MTFMRTIRLNLHPPLPTIRAQPFQTDIKETGKYQWRPIYCLFTDLDCKTLNVTYVCCRAIKTTIIKVAAVAYQSLFNFHSKLGTAKKYPSSIWGWDSNP